MEQLNVEASSIPPNPNGEIEFNDDDSNDIWSEDDFIGDFGDSSVLNREWERRHIQFHTMGYRDGISAGKEDSAQEGFNHGYKESVYAGYSWGLVRGLSSAISSLPEQLKQKLFCNPQHKEKFERLHESTQAVSSIKALQIFYSSIQQNDSGDSVEDNSFNQLDVLSKDLKALLSESAELNLDLSQIKISA